MIFGKHINRYYLKHLPALLFGILSLLMVDILQLKMPEFYNLIVNGLDTGAVEIDGVTRTFDWMLLLEEVCMPMVFVIIFMTFGRFLWRICFFGSAIKVETSIRAKMFAHSRNLSQEFYSKNKVGGLMSLFTNDLETIQECFGDGIMMLGDALLLGVLAIVKMARMNGLLTLLALIPMVFLFAVGAIVGKSLMDKWEERQEAFSELSDFTQESFSGISVVKAFVKEFKELMAFRIINRKNEKVNVAFVKLSTLMHISVTLFVESVICIILGYGSYLVKQGSFNAGDLVEFIGYFTAIVWPVMAVSSLIDMTARGKASLKRISEFLDTKEDVTDREDVTDIDTIAGDIELRDLTFRYPGGDYDVLSHVSMKIKAGENIGIVGKTGCGKTTLVDLILRTYNVPDGTVLIDGRDVNTIPIKTVRENAAYVPQDNFLFSDTIENNIAFATVEHNIADHHEAVEKAARLADVHENIVGFHDGYHTMLGERGVTVSGGQKQRISIARALMKNAPILILDDSVSAVDTKTEKSILSHLRETRKGKTTILIAHRISTVENMDKIAFLEDGKLIAFGTNEELLATCEGYQNLVKLQKLEEGGDHNA